MLKKHIGTLILKTVSSFCLLCILTKNSYAIDHNQYKSDAENILNSNTININTATSQTSDSQLQESVPGFKTSTPPETQYLGNPGTMESDAVLLSETNEVSQTVHNSFNTRPKVDVDETDTFLIKSTAIMNNPNTIINSVTNEYPECTETGGETIINTATRTCDEYIQQTSTNCTTGQEIVIDNNTQYHCKRYREYQTKECKKELKVECTAYKECNTGGIELNTIATDLYWNYNYPHLSIGRGGGNYWGGWCTTYDRTITFNVSSLDRIEYFLLTRVRFDDYISVSINDHILYVGPTNGTNLYTNGHGVFDGITWRGCELYTIWDQNIYSRNIDLKPHLKQGINTLKMRVIVAGSGQGSMYFLLKNKCC
ncbi:hypothetical protein ACFL0U_01985, partial [Pseudomonadota bacterium]